MFKPLVWKALTLSTIAAAILVGADNAVAQSDSDLRQENQRLRTQVKDLQREWEAAQRRIESLQHQIEELRELLIASERAAPPAAAPAATQPKTEKVSIDESIPNASPRALLNAIKESYQDAMGDLDIGSPGNRMRTAYMRALDRWAARVNRELRSQIQWHVRLIDFDQTRRGRQRAMAVDPKTRVELGDPFEVIISRNLARRLEPLSQRGEREVLQLKGVLVPEVRLNKRREEPGPFNHPRLIGPFAEFAFTVEASSLTPVEKQEAPPATERPQDAR